MRRRPGARPRRSRSSRCGAGRAEALRVQAEAEAHAYEERVKAADAPERHPALLRLAELQTLRELARNANARLYFDFDRHGLALNESDAKPSSS